jgi:hypothetical protein
MSNVDAFREDDPYPAGTFFGREIFDLSSVEIHVAAQGWLHTGDRPHQRGLSDPVRTQQADQFTRGKREVKAGRYHLGSLF